MQNILADITAQNWILALFIRDDGERFLLGTGAYEFKKSLQHFQPNTYANDVVELQGTDGQLLAGQVRRTASQPFDGYIADQTINQTETENRRRAFLMFFRKKHFYTVAYILPNGTAIQRRRGYITDAPAVAEMIQRWPEYHVALNFEDPNYYEYAEDEDGNPIYAHEVELALAGASVGGLVWDEDGVVWDGGIDWRTLQTVQGSFINLDNALDIRTPLSSVELLGNTTQDGTPTPDAPVAVQTTTGEQVVKMCGKNLFDYTTIQQTTKSGVSCSLDSDGTITLNGTCTADNTFFDMPNTSVHLDGTYTLSFVVVSGTISNATTNTAIRLYQANYTQGFTLRLGQTTARNTMSRTGDYVLKSLRADNGVVFDNYKIKIQLEVGSTATDFEPYQSQSYEVNLGSIELCKLGTYQDYIWKDGEDWKVHKAIKKVALSDVTNWQGYAQGSLKVHYFEDSQAAGGSLSSNPIVTNGFHPKFLIEENSCFLGSNNHRVNFCPLATLNWTNYIADNHPVVYYALATPVDEQITNSDLIDQLDALASSTLFVGVNNIALVPSGGAQGELKIIYPTDYALTGGAIWEIGGSGGQNIITVDGVDSAFPVWEVVGPATNPTLTNTTTGQSIQWTGTVPNSQSLVVDMFEQTATMAGANVFQYIDGQWIRLDAGNNTLTYTATGATAPSILSWNGVVG